ncbi:MAG: type II toxin-antitoxin system PemK/MazF family toxin [Pseudobdellovibrionaceae bacterium]|nr:MAG: type II toxin-antitoxin system PemK/MazF family toxin [Pseudobdellovibrionaceae bacterium]
MKPQQWHFYIVNLEPRVGTKPGKQRACLAVQPSEFALAGLDSTVILPLTTNVAQSDAFPLRVFVPKDTCGLAQASDLLVDQILSWDNSLFVKDLGVAPDGIIEEVKHAIREFLDLTTCH